MELREFVCETLKQVLAGVKEAQKSEGGEHINAASFVFPKDSKVFTSGSYGTFTIVEFDVAVSAETSGKGGANLSVFGVGLEGGGQHKAGHANRVSFAVPLRLPDGDISRVKNLTADRPISGLT